MISLLTCQFAFNVSLPIGVMLWVGHNTHEKLNVENFWPDPARMNRPPTDPVEIQAEVERMRLERVARRKRLEEKAKELGIMPPSSSSDKDN